MHLVFVSPDFRAGTADIRGCRFPGMVRFQAPDSVLRSICYLGRGWSRSVAGAGPSTCPTVAQRADNKVRPLKEGGRCVHTP